MNVELPEFAGSDGFARIRGKARVFLRAHQDHLTIRKLRMNEPLTALDLRELERLLAESAVAKPEQWEEAKASSSGLGLFVRGLVGMDREAAKQALNAFTVGKAHTGNQIEFVNLVVDHLTAHGAVPPALLY